MKVVCLPSDQGACGYNRLIWPAEFLCSQGCDVDVRFKVEAVWEDGLFGPKLVSAAELDADVVVFQRVFRPDMLLLMRAFQQQGVTVVIDLDDDVMALPTTHPVYRHLHPKLSTTGRSWAILLEACRIADLVTVSTPALAKRYASHGRVRVVPNGVPSAYLGIRARLDKPRENSPPLPLIGWPGTYMHPGDLEVMGEAAKGVPARWRFWDRSAPARLSVEGEIAPFADLASFDYARAVAKLDIGIAPLADSAFNRSKSWLKPLEYASLGVPWVASPREEYRRLYSKTAGGMLAERPREWKKALGKLCGSADLRMVLGMQGRLAAEAMTVENMTAPRVWEAWIAARVR